MLNKSHGMGQCKIYPIFPDTILPSKSGDLGYNSASSIEL